MVATRNVENTIGKTFAMSPMNYIAERDKAKMLTPSKVIEKQSSRVKDDHGKLMCCPEPHKANAHGAEIDARFEECV
jgi:hypothetical protein